MTDFNNQDFCFFDLIIPERTPEAIRAKQAEMRELLDRRILALELLKQSEEDEQKKKSALMMAEAMKSSQEP